MKLHTNRWRGVLFDLDGTLIDAFGPIVTALNQVLVEFGHEALPADTIRRNTGRGDAHIMGVFGEQWPEAHARFLLLHDELYLKQIAQVAGADDLLRWLREAQIPVSVVTNKAQQRAEAQIAHLGWSSLVATIIGAMPGRPGKPDPYPVHLAAETIGLTADCCLLAGDGISDMLAARAANSLPLGLTYTFDRHELAEAGAAHCFDNLLELHQWIRQ